MTSSQTSSRSAAATFLVYVPRETHQVGGLEYVERKPWKYQTEKRFKHSICDDYAIRVPSSKFPKPANADNKSASYITLEVKVGNNAESAPGHVCQIFIEEGYAWDGACVPTFDTCGSFHAALVHDALYQCMRLGYVERDCSRKAADKLLLDMLKRGGMGWLRRQLWYWVVYLFGKKSTLSKPHKGRRYPGIGGLLLGVAGLVYWAYSKWQALAQWLDPLEECLRAWGIDLEALWFDFVKSVLRARGIDLEVLCKVVCFVEDALALTVTSVLVRLGFELWKGDSCLPEKVDSSSLGNVDSAEEGAHADR